MGGFGGMCRHLREVWLFELFSRGVGNSRTIRDLIGCAVGKAGTGHRWYMVC